jgi:hypothetical protein
MLLCLNESAAIKHMPRGSLIMMYTEDKTRLHLESRELRPSIILRGKLFSLGRKFPLHSPLPETAPTPYVFFLAEASTEKQSTFSNLDMLKCT